MKRLFLLGLLLVLGACQKEDSGVYVNPTFVDPGAAPAVAIEKIAVVEFASAVHVSDDPDGVAQEMMERIFLSKLNARTDYHFVSPSTVRFAMERAGLIEQFDAFLKSFPKDGIADVELLKSAADALKVDAFLVPVVYQWQKDEVDFREDATPTTYVGATVSILDAKSDPGKLLFKVTQEDYLEGARSETESRSTMSSAGILRSDSGKKSYRAPPFEGVATKVVEALVAALPAR